MKAHIKQLKTWLVPGTLICLFTLAPGCKSLEVTPTSELGYYEGISSSAGLEGVVNAAFGRYMQQVNASTIHATYFDQILYWEALAAKNVTLESGAVASGITFDINQFKILETSALLSSLSTNRSATVTAANIVIDAVNQGTAQDGDFAIQRDRFLGEAYFCRGTAFFDGVRMWAHQYGYKSNDVNSGIAIPTKVPVNGKPNVGRSTTEQSYTQIIDDLTKATQLLPVAYDATIQGKFPAFRFRANRAGAFGILARVYFQQGSNESYQKSLDAINAILGTTPGAITATANTGTRVYTLQPFHSGTTIASGGPFNSTGFTIAPAGTEEIIRLVNNTTNTQGYKAASTTLTNESGGNPASRGAVRWVLKRPNPNVPLTTVVTTSALFDDVVNDKRFTILTANNNFGTTTAPRNERYSLKWGTQVGALVGYQTCPMLRAGELVITRAEINAALNNLPAAVADYNLIRTRAGAPVKILGSVNFTTKSEVLAEIVKERQREMLFEGDDYWAWKRMAYYNSKNGSVYPATEVAPFERGGVFYEWNSNKSIFKLSDDDINLNEFMGPGAQNPD